MQCMKQVCAHLLRIDLAVDNNPGAAAELCTRGKVHCHRLPVRPKRLHYERASLVAEQQRSAALHTARRYDLCHMRGMERRAKPCLLQPLLCMPMNDSGFETRLCSHLRCHSQYVCY